MNGLREDLSATGSAVLAEGEGLRVTPPSIAALGRAVAVLRGHLLPVRVRGNGDAPVEAPPGGALLELTALDRIASVDGATGIARVEAGCSVAALETSARRAGASFALGPRRFGGRLARGPDARRTRRPRLPARDGCPVGLRGAGGRAARREPRRSALRDWP